ncbi:hypothetical protein [Mycobacterium branderi]|uniref:Sodium:proton antiporter n=1 Tax=Mycobacterium branderi TaxID=43348 RepID=A0A7I7WAL5_9MYCO|nr:hypothetical protein [Mycobacterium branderi]MCV7232515.1 hypothetical protein [Mycobacterium branderi]ORA40681.1 hypothetical protein BST20_00475 [Mycobacterium branderi]BBZ14544.1 hypothetical protein MBRA_47390 [Mycobacterium branderi]
MPGPGDRFAALTEILLWWALTAAVWLATLTSFTAAELAVAVGATLPCAVAARSARRANRGYWRFRVDWFRWAATILRDVPLQAFQTWMYVLMRRRRGVISAVSLPAEPEPVADARRAVVVLAFATTPGTVVLDCNSQVLLHRIRPGTGRLARAVQR